MICDECGTKEALDAMGLTEGSSVRKSILACVGRGSTPQERVRAKVQATGNKWAMENFRDTHKKDYEYLKLFLKECYKKRRMMIWY